MIFPPPTLTRCMKTQRTLNQKTELARIHEKMLNPVGTLLAAIQSMI